MVIPSSSVATGSEDEDEQPQDAAQLPPPPSSEEGQGAERAKDGVDEGELKKQEMLVQYLRDTEGFALQVERAIAIINNMLYWKTTTGERGSR